MTLKGDHPSCFWETLVATEESLTATNNSGSEPSHYAAHNGHCKVLRLLHQCNPEALEAEDNEGKAGVESLSGQLVFLHECFLCLISLILVLVIGGPLGVVYIALLFGPDSLSPSLLGKTS